MLSLLPKWHLPESRSSFPNEMITIMYTVGKKLPAELREPASAAVQLHRPPAKPVIYAAKPKNILESLSSFMS